MEAAAAAERGSMFSPGQEEPSAPDKEPVKYGELVVLGYNGALPNGDRGRRKSRFALYKRTKANGVKPSTIHVVSTPQASKVGSRCRWRCACTSGLHVGQSFSHVCRAELCTVRCVAAP